MINKIETALKPFIKRILFRPRNITYGFNSYILRPCTIHGAASIFLGNHTVVLGDGYISAITSYGGLRHTPRISIGNSVYIGRHSYLTAIDGITIEDGCVLSEHVYITDLMHGIHPDRGLIMEQPLESKGPVRIGANSFLGYRTAVMPGVTLGAHCVVGANSVVTRSFPSYSMIAGSPAKLIRTYDVKTKDWLKAI